MASARELEDLLQDCCGQPELKDDVLTADRIILPVAAIDFIKVKLDLNNES